MVWVVLAVLACLLIYGWEREEKLLQRAERAEREVVRLHRLAWPSAETMMLPSGARVEVFAWPEKVIAGRTNTEAN
jgi:hypothetical protein